MARIYTLFVPLLLLVAICIGAGPWTLTPLAKPVKGIGYSQAVIVNGAIIFMELGANSGIKRWEDGKVTTLVPGHAIAPELGLPFIGLSKISFDGTHVAFVGHTQLKTKGFPQIDGVYRFDDGKISRVVDANMDVPGKPDTKFRFFHDTSINQSLVAFDATDWKAVAGVYCVDDKGLHVVAIPGTPAPSGREKFSDAGAGFVSERAVIFRAGTTTTPSQFVHGVYAWQDGKITTLFDSTKQFSPGGRFITMDISAVDGRDVCGNGQFGGTGVFYKFVKGKPVAVVSMRQDIPAIGGKPNGIENGVIKDGNVLCVAGRMPGRALLSDVGGALTKILASGDTLDGKIVEGMDLSRQAFDGERAVITITFRDMSSMIYLATPPTKPGQAPTQKTATKT